MINPIAQLQALKNAGIYKGEVPSTTNKAMRILSRVNKETLKKFSAQRGPFKGGKLITKETK